MTRRDDQSRISHEGPDREVPADLRAVDALLSEALAEWSRTDVVRAARIHRETVGSIGVPVAPRRVAKAPSAAGWRWAFYVGGGLAAAAAILFVVRSGGDAEVPSPAKAPVQVVEVPAPAADPVDAGVEARPSAAEPVLVALIERDASRWSEDWTGDDSYGYSSAWAAVVPVLETRDTGFDTVADEIGDILVGSIGGSGSSGGSFR